MSLSRRELITGAGAVILLAACGKKSPTAGRATSSSGATGTTSLTGTTAPTVTTAGVATPGSCVLAPEQTEGPYYIDGEAVRSDITEGKAGTPLHLALTVVDAASCVPVANAAVEIWHADAGGNYSGFGSTTSNRTFLRGIQTTAANGGARFTTIYPGWYQGRAAHIHVKVRTGSATVHTGQLYFDDAVSGTVFGRSPYSSRGNGWLHNSQDGIYRSGGAQSLLTLQPDADGFVGTMTLDIKRA